MDNHLIELIFGLAMAVLAIVARQQKIALVDQQEELTKATSQAKAAEQQASQNKSALDTVGMLAGSLTELARAMPESVAAMTTQMDKVQEENAKIVREALKSFTDFTGENRSANSTILTQVERQSESIAAVASSLTQLSTQTDQGFSQLQITIDNYSTQNKDTMTGQKKLLDAAIANIETQKDNVQKLISQVMKVVNIEPPVDNGAS